MPNYMTNSHSSNLHFFFLAVTLLFQCEVWFFIFFLRSYFAFLLSQVEGVSYLEMSDKTDRGSEDLTLDQVASSDQFQELMKVPESSEASDFRAINTNDEITAKMNDKLLEESKTDHSPTETDDHHNNVWVNQIEAFVFYSKL